MAGKKGSRNLAGLTPEEKREWRAQQNRESARRCYQKNREKQLARQRKWREENLELKRRIMRESVQKRRAENPEHHRQIQRKWRQDESPEQRANRLSRIAAWHKEHRAEMREYGRKYDVENPGARKAKWREKYPDKAKAARKRALERIRKRREENPEEVRAYFTTRARQSRARHVPTPGHHTPADIEALYQAQQGKCAACSQLFPAKGKHRFEVDHIIPLKPRNGGKAGSNAPENLQLLCKPCNISKGNLDHGEWLKRRSKKR